MTGIFTFDKIEVSSANILQIEDTSWGESFIYIWEREVVPTLIPVEPYYLFCSKKNWGITVEWFVSFWAYR